MSSINRSPLGLLGFLGIKNFGRNPTALGDMLAPVWDLEGLYLGAEARYATNTLAGVGVGNLIVHSPPNGTVWCVLQYGFYVGTLAASSVVCSPIIIAGSASQVALLGPEAVLGASASTQLYAPLNGPLYLAPGESLGVSVNAVTGTADVQTRVRYVEMQI